MNMSKSLKILTGFSLLLLAAALFFGMISGFAFLYPGSFNEYLPFYQLRPMHVSAALFWIISGATTGILFYKQQVFGAKENFLDRTFVLLWLSSIIAVFVFYAFKQFGGREYWEFPPFLGIPILLAWFCLIGSYFKAWRRRPAPTPLYIWMWSTGIIFFLITFLEQNLYQIPWFRESFLRELTVQWKSNGAMVGAWNQMIYGTSLFIAVKLSGDTKAGNSNKAFFFYFLGLTNLMFNWGHHIYNLPTSSWIRHISYAISMTEWILFISILRDFRKKTSQQRHSGRISYRFLIVAEYWVFANLCLALMMSIPAINRYTHGTHITVAHAMGATIGINSMILLASLATMLKVDRLALRRRQNIRFAFRIFQFAFVVFWLALIVAGVLKGYREVALGIADFQIVMKPIWPVLLVFVLAGVVMFVSMVSIVFQFISALRLPPLSATAGLPVATTTQIPASAEKPKQLI